MCHYVPRTGPFWFRANPASSHTHRSTLIIPYASFHTHHSRRIVPHSSSHAHRLTLVRQDTFAALAREMKETSKEADPVAEASNGPNMAMFEDTVPSAEIGSQAVAIPGCGDPGLWGSRSLGIPVFWDPGMRGCGQDVGRSGGGDPGDVGRMWEDQVGGVGRSGGGV